MIKYVKVHEDGRYYRWAGECGSSEHATLDLDRADLIEYPGINNLPVIVSRELADSEPVRSIQADELLVAADYIEERGFSSHIVDALRNRAKLIKPPIRHSKFKCPVCQETVVVPNERHGECPVCTCAFTREIEE